MRPSATSHPSKRCLREPSQCESLKAPIALDVCETVSASVPLRRLGTTPPLVACKPFRGSGPITLEGGVYVYKTILGLVIAFGVFGLIGAARAVLTLAESRCRLESLIARRLLLFEEGELLALRTRPAIVLLIESPVLWLGRIFGEGPILLFAEHVALHERAHVVRF